MCDLCDIIWLVLCWTLAFGFARNKVSLLDRMDGNGMLKNTF